MHNRSYFTKTFTKEELEYKDNVIFGVTLISIYLDSSYNQVEISASKAEERMKQRNLDPFIQKLVIYLVMLVLTEFFNK